MPEVPIILCHGNLPCSTASIEDPDGTPVTTTYLIDSYNHTGYAQVLQQTRDTSPETQVTTFTIGDDVISQAKIGGPSRKWYLYDGQGSVRQIVRFTQAVEDTYSYDAYGVMLGGNPQPGSSPATNLLYAGEWFDTDAQMYYNRARYYNPSNGRFNRTDPFAGNAQDPQSLHKYLYCHNNPINAIDPSGMFSLTEISVTIGIMAAILPVANMAAWSLLPDAQGTKNNPPSAYVVSISVGGVARVGPLLTGVGGEFSADFLYIKSKRMWYDYMALGGSIGIAGAAFTVEAGPVWEVEEKKDYEGLYFSSSFGGSKGFFSFAGLGLGPGAGVNFFWAPLGRTTTGKKSYGWKAGPVLLGTAGPIYSFTASVYRAGPFSLTRPILDFLNQNVVPPNTNKVADARNFAQTLKGQLE